MVEMTATATACPRCTTGISSGIVPSMATTTPKPGKDKVRENRLRRMATRQNKTLRRDPVRDPYAAKYGIYYVDGVEVGDMDAVERHLKGE